MTRRRTGSHRCCRFFEASFICSRVGVGTIGSSVFACGISAGAARSLELGASFRRSMKGDRLAPRPGAVELNGCFNKNAVCPGGVMSYLRRPFYVATSQSTRRRRNHRSQAQRPQALRARRPSQGSWPVESGRPRDRPSQDQAASLGGGSGRIFVGRKEGRFRVQHP